MRSKNCDFFFSLPSAAWRARLAAGLALRARDSHCEEVLFADNDACGWMEKLNVGEVVDARFDCWSRDG